MMLKVEKGQIIDLKRDFIKDIYAKNAQGFILLNNTASLVYSDYITVVPFFSKRKDYEYIETFNDKLLENLDINNIENTYTISNTPYTFKKEDIKKTYRKVDAYIINNIKENFKKML